MEGGRGIRIIMMKDYDVKVAEYMYFQFSMVQSRPASLQLNEHEKFQNFTPQVIFGKVV